VALLMFFIEEKSLGWRKGKTFFWSAAKMQNFVSMLSF
jgi:hypothetical protein